MSFFKIVCNSCLAGLLVISAGCATNSQPAKPKMTPEQAAIAALSSSQKAERLLLIMQADKLSTPIYMQVQQTFEQLFIESKAPDSKKAVLERYLAKADAVLNKNIGWNTVKPEFINYYTNTYTDAELTKLIEFFESPLGLKWAKQPPLALLYMQLFQAKQAQFGPELNDLIEQMAKELNFSLKTLKPMKK